MSGRLLRLSWRGLKRDLRSGDVRALFVALALAVAASTMIGFFLDRLDRGLTRQAGQLLGGDVVLEQSRPFEAELRETLEAAGLTLSDQVDMVSMVSRGDAFQSVSLKAVDDVYPHYGASRVSRGGKVEEVAAGPPRGEVWIAPRLAMLMDLQSGDSLRVGSATFRVGAVIEREADPSAGFGSFNPRLMMHVDDLRPPGWCRKARASSTSCWPQGRRRLWRRLRRCSSDCVARASRCGMCARTGPGWAAPWRVPIAT